MTKTKNKMGRKKKEQIEATSVELIDIKERLRDVIVKKYGSVSAFLETKEGQEFGGNKIRPYLYDKGAINYAVIERLCKYFGVGLLSRKLVVSRTYTYQLVPTTTK